MLASERPVWREITRLTSPDVRVAATSKAWRDSWEQSLLFSSSIKKTIRDILWILTWDTDQKKAKGQEALLTGCRIFISSGSREGARGARPPPPRPPLIFRPNWGPKGWIFFFGDRPLPPLISESWWPGPSYLKVWIRYCLWYSHSIVTSLVLISCVG